MEIKRKNLIIGLMILISIIVLLSILILTGVLNLAALKKFFSGEDTVIEPDTHLMTSRNAYDIALLKAREWQSDAGLARIISSAGVTGPNGRADNWDLIFVSQKIKGKAYHIIIENKVISFTEEIQFVGVGGELPENIISSKEAVARIHQVKGYENESIISVEMLYDPNGKWFWGIKTTKGVVSVMANK